MRLERKYLVPIEQLSWLRNRIAPFTRPDVFARQTDAGRAYTVRSIYFDTPDLSDYYEKVEGIRTRKKVRLRGYNQLSEDSTLFLEIKRKKGARIWKNRAPFPAAHCDSLFEIRDIDRYVPENPRRPQARDDARRFFYHICRRSLRPAILVVYEREPFHGVFDPGIRITFDKNLRSILHPSLDQLFDEAFQKFATPGHFILEVKYDEAMPRWMKSIIEELRLGREALSKYVLCLNSQGFSRFVDRPVSGLPRPFAFAR